MNKNKKLIPTTVFAIAIFIFVFSIGFFIGPALQEYNEQNSSSSETSTRLSKTKEQYEKMEAKQKQEELQMKSVKQVLESGTSKAAENLSAFGTMFDDIIKHARENDLLIRSIEYDLKPTSDAIYSANSVAFNACELKLYLVGKYAHLRGFLNEIVNHYPYLISVSKLNVTAFEGNTDYLVIKLSLVLYSKKAMPQ